MRVSRPLAAVTVLGAAVAGLAAASPAGAATPAPTTLRQAQRQAERVINSDRAALRFYADVVKGDTAVPTADKNVLLPVLTADSTALAALAKTVSTETTIAAVEADLSSVAGYNLGDFVFPQTALYVGSDDITAAATKAGGAEAALQAAITAAQTAGKSVAAADTALADYQTKVAAAAALGSAVHTSAAALTAGITANAATIKADAIQLGQAERDLQAAARDTRQIIRSPRRR